MIIGRVIAVISFVCSVGNVPLAAVLWSSGISFAGVLAFIYADKYVVTSRQPLEPGAAQHDASPGHSRHEHAHSPTS